ncbi:MAG TPA: type IV pili methyl-accepting chemotaxis transducer N-terminal domain-containing protein [Halomonas sp.]|nr:type IV pili methyl-accepting chemotaxis transducer N-terminal domain-containing protein [Halomonas sp.]
MKLLQRSLVARIVASLLAITGMALISIAVTMTVANSSRGDAAAINVAGSLRMNSYQIATALLRYQQRPGPQERQQVEHLAERFHQRLTSAELTGAIPSASEHVLNHRYQELLLRWEQQLAPQIYSAVHSEQLDGDAMLGTLNDLVATIDRMVTLLQKNSESKIHLLGALQILFLALTAAVVAIALYDIRHNLVRPLRQLVVMAREAGRRRFDYRSHLTGSDELALLGQTFNTMAAELATSYADLEERVAHRKAELETSNQAMQVLHDGSRALYGGGNDLCASAAPMLRQLERLLGIGPFHLSLHDPCDDRDVRILATQSPSRPSFCHDYDCHACLLKTSDRNTANSASLRLPVSMGDTQLGLLEVGYPAGQTISDSTRQLLNALTDQLATAVYLQRRIEQQQQVTLINERTIIARELHDSLAQSLSYLKMQVARLERMQAKGMPQKTQAAVFDELRTGLDSAYRQLRELLTTFRLKLEGTGLASALQQTIEEFSRRLGFTIELKFNIPPYLLSPSEEIHVLQVIREALANVHKHARAYWACVSVQFSQAQVTVTIEDDGTGFGSVRSPPMHYGLVIMRDRSETLGGELTFDNRPQGGARVVLEFLPHTARLIAHQPASATPAASTVDSNSSHRNPE